MKFIFIGPQGCGKGTQAKIIANKLGICHISTGDLLRATDGELGKRVRSYIDKGNLFPDELIVELFKERISKDDCKNGFILDGFPRNLNQAEELDKIVNVGDIKVVEIYISDDESIRRISGRRICPKCGMIWNINTSPKPVDFNKCDKCDSELKQRADDNEEYLKKRLKIYHKETEPVLERYSSIRINGEQSVEKVTEDILEVLKD